ncbi:biotin--[acetyl-CoA-carboxylase] ligase [Cellulophaga baltica]|uniref:BirA family transcriptional regulator, biotin operon repressor / biotin-[acetyl-CoA-carboxylase] ligase n=1 Tax=Cellulophaga baltica TaxID=76594 RepID=A0A1G7KMB3_9FLAO|nr:biotin--[acetyl-CoA-carboxylase] ligase [Cellulophaga baltica]SDF38276.1 BirA family transcriptional regulator, biotin operon repressor / biotin-[acetyl-CoA-carboxylase] ligase [Cellulophaga baltica]
MQIIKLDAIDSTNVYLKDLVFNTQASDYTIVVAEKQTSGRGQMGTAWLADEGKNLTFSILKKCTDLSVQEQFDLNICVSVAIYRSLNDLKIPDLKIKWPNDILSGNHKICGVLIENILSGAKIQASIIGIGLNVNQLSFDNLPNVSSLKLITGIQYDLDELLKKIAKNLEEVFDYYFMVNKQDLKIEYLEQLFRKDKASTFSKDANDTMFTGIIRNVTSEGKLVLEEEDEIFNEYALKELKLRY